MSHPSQERQADESVLPLKRSLSRRQDIETPATDDASLEDAPAGANPRGKKVSPLWLFASLPFLTLATSALAAPRMEIYTILVCRILRPEYSDSMYTLNENGTQSCATDPVVQAGLSKLVAVLTVSSGLISCLTTSWWGSFSDRHGRKFALGISIFGMILSSLNVILVSKFPSSLPGKHWFLLVGSVLEALMGGIATMSAAVEAYVVDCTDSSSRSRMLSIVTGILSIGGTLGPTFGGLLIHASHSVLLVFYVSVAVLLCYAVLVLTVVPESLPKEQMVANKNAYAGRPPGHSVLATVLAPLTMFAPTRFETADGQRKTDWNLTLIGVAYGIFCMLMGPTDYLLQYTSYVFAWTSEFISYWIGVTGMTRTLFCLLIFPVTIAWLKRRSPAASLPIAPSEPLHVPLLPDGADPSSEQPTLEEAHSSSFDHSLARVSSLIYIVTYAVMGMATTGWLFTAASTLAQFGTGYLPSLHSLAMGMFILRERRRKGAQEGGLAPSEVGKLYSSLAVIQAFCMVALGPGVFALIFMVTVEFFPAAIFLFIVVGLSISLYLLSLVQLPKGSVNGAGRED